MKRKWHHPDETDSVSRDYWRGYDQLEDTPEFRDWLTKEFPRGAAEVVGEEADESTRRGFLKYMGASASLAGFGMAGCRRPDQYLVPYNEHVDGVIAGKALYYATARPTAEGCVPLVVATYEGRPTKVDGNKLHPGCSGGSDVFTQASVLDLYDPDRSKEFRHNGEVSDAAAFEEGFLAGFRESGGKKAAILVGSSTSPTQARLLDELGRKYAGLQVFEYEPLVSRARREAEARLWGEGVSAVPSFDRADRILSLDSDFLGLDAVGEDPGAQWSSRRDPGKDMSRLYVVEPAFTVTGGVADHRLRIPASQVIKVAVLLAEKLGLGSAVAPLAGQLGLSRKVISEAWVEETAKDLLASRGKALVVAGPRQPMEVHLLAGLMNQALGAVGKSLKLVRDGRKLRPGLAGLAEAISTGAVETLIVTTPADPLYDAPGGLGLAEVFAGLENLVHLGERLNATARAAAWHVPGAHYLESWGDARTATGTLSVIQPMILPLFDGWSGIDLFLQLLEKPAVPQEGEVAPPMNPALAAVKKTFAGLARGDVEKAWGLTLKDGFARGVSYPVAQASATAATGALAGAEFADFPHRDSIEVVLTPSSHLWDGRFVNNSWLQELPDPITKLTWDNAALMSLNTAESLDVTHDGQMILVDLGEGMTLEVPVLRIPGHADHAISLALGYGQEDAGRVGEGTGFNAYRLLAREGGFIRTGAKAARAGAKYELAPTAIHWSMEGRAIVREGSLKDFEAHPDFAKEQGMDSHIPPNIPLYKGPDYFRPNDDQPEGPMQSRFQIDERHQWGMTIDLNSCIGCNACTVACQAENNIPVVGKEEVIRGREMHWIRMDRYFSSPREEEGMTAQRVHVPERRGRPAHDDDAVEMISQPVACVQCEYAPCETVCPVNATVHTDDGLNAMTYNRCIGTRYCANNCPYKARRFNYFDYNKRRAEDFHLGPLAPAAGLGTTSLKLQKNPHVTVRMRGVIEKCTYCVQRIQEAKIEAKTAARDSDDVQVPANAVTTACQDVCPTRAISFGNLRNPEDEVNRMKENPRNYDLLKYVGTRPRTSYLARVRNPNPKMPGAKHVGQNTAHMH